MLNRFDALATPGVSGTTEVATPRRFPSIEWGHAGTVPHAAASTAPEVATVEIEVTATSPAHAIDGTAASEDNGQKEIENLHKNENRRQLHPHSQLQF